MTVAHLCVATLLMALTEIAYGAESLSTDKPLSEGARHHHLHINASASRLMSQIEDLFRLQDETARGLPNSIAAQKNVLINIGQALATEPLDAARPLALHAAAYALSGGNPEAVERLSTSDALDGEQKNLLRAVTAFMRGEKEEASRLFVDIHPSSYPGFLSGRLALARAVLAADATARQQEDLGFAISAMPGTLVEESALRRSAIAYGETKDEKKFFQRIERYGRRFSRSVYAQGFLQDAAEIVAEWKFEKPGAVMPNVDASIAHLPAEQRRQFYVDLVRGAAASGQRELTETAAQRLADLAGSGTAEDELSKLYNSLYAVVTSGSEAALQSLETIDRSKINKRDQTLLDAALSIGRRLSAPVVVLPRSPRAEDTATDPVMEKANSLLKQIDELLRERRS